MLELVLETPNHSSWAGLPAERLVSAAHAVARWHKYARRTDTARDPEWLKLASLISERRTELQPSNLAAAARMEAGGNRLLKRRCGLEIEFTLPRLVGPLLPPREYLSLRSWRPPSTKRTNTLQRTLGDLPGLLRSFQMPLQPGMPSIAFSR